MWITGPSGCGKSSTIKVLCELSKFQVVEVPISEQYGVIKEMIDSVINTQGLEINPSVILLVILNFLK